MPSASSSVSADVPVFYGQIVLSLGDAGASTWSCSASAATPGLDSRPQVTRPTSSAADVAAGRGRLASGADDASSSSTRAASRRVLAWHVVRARPPPAADWNVIVDATTGHVDRTPGTGSTRPTASGSIFDPNPVQDGGDTAGFVDANDADGDSTHRRPRDRPCPDPPRLGQHTQGRLRRPHRHRVSPARHFRICRARRTPRPATTTTPAVDDPLRGGERLLLDHRGAEADPEPRLQRRQQPVDSGRRPLLRRRQLVLLAPLPGASLRRRRRRRCGGCATSSCTSTATRFRTTRYPASGPVNIEQGAIGEGFGDFFAGMVYLDHGQRDLRVLDAPLLHRRLGCRPRTTTSPARTIGSGCLRWIDGTRRVRPEADLGAYSGTPARSTTTALLVGGDDLHLRGPGRQRRGPQQRPPPRVRLADAARPDHGHHGVRRPSRVDDRLRPQHLQVRASGADPQLRERAQHREPPAASRLPPPRTDSGSCPDTGPRPDAGARPAAGARAQIRPRPKP